MTSSKKITLHEYIEEKKAQLDAAEAKCRADYNKSPHQHVDPNSPEQSIFWEMIVGEVLD